MANSMTTEGLAHEGCFNTLNAEWVALRQRRVKRWEESLKAMTAEAERLRAAGSWQTGPTDFFGVTGRSRHELTHSAMLGWLLDSTGRHGLGNRLAVALLSLVGLDVGAADHFVVSREVSGGNAADLVLSGGGLKVVIENKVDAIEQPLQCQRLTDDHPDAQALIPRRTAFQESLHNSPERVSGGDRGGGSTAPAGASRDGSDGTRTRDLRRDRSASGSLTRGHSMARARLGMRQLCASRDPFQAVSGGLERRSWEGPLISEVPASAGNPTPKRDAPGKNRTCARGLGNRCSIH